MSAIAFDRIGFETETSQAAPVRSPRPRDEEFRAALDRYMTGYIACQKRRNIGHHSGAECHSGGAQTDLASSAPARRLRRCVSCLSAPW